MNYLKLIIFLIIFTTTISCGNSKNGDARDENVVLKSEILRLNEELQAKDSILNNALGLISEVSANLDQIKIEEGMMINQGEFKVAAKEKIGSDLNKLSAKLKQTNSQLKKLTALEKRLSDMNIKMEGFSTMVASLKKSLSERNRSLQEMIVKNSEMRQEVSVLNSEVEDLQDNNEALTETLIEKVRESNSRYFIVGVEKDLKDAGLIEKVRGWSSELKLSQNIDYSELKKIDINDVDYIYLNCRKAEIIGNFPEGSYKLIKSDSKIISKIEIIDPDSFWRDNKILVIVIK